MKPSAAATVSAYEPAHDPRGHTLLATRLASLPGWARGYASAAPLSLSPKTHATRHFVIVGTGSSEAHGRFLAHAINRYSTASAEFSPLSGFLEDAPEARRGKTLVVFSQGLSPNAQTAFGRRSEFAHTVVFTASTASGSRASGRTARAQLLESLELEGAEIVRFPLEDEYTTLIRLAGPLCAYLACWRFVAALGGTRLPLLSPVALDTALAALPKPDLSQDFLRHVGDFRRGFYIVASAPLSEFSQNLCYKFMEGLFWSAPVVWDYLQFAHGPFQEVSLNPRPVLLVRLPNETDADLCARTERMLSSVGLKAIRLDLASTGLAAILEVEMILNHVVLDLIRQLDVDQVNWPSKGRDDPLYGFFRV